MHQDRISKSSNMLHYSIASSIEKNRRYLVIKGGGLPGFSGKQEGSSTPQSNWAAAVSVSQSTGEKREGRNSKYNANISMTMRDMTMSSARCVLTRQQVVPAKGGTSGKVFPLLRVSDKRTGGGKLHVCYARDVWRTNGLHIRIRLVVLSNFHVESIFI